MCGGASIEAAVSDGMRALHLAARGGHTGCIQQLLRAGADSEAVDNRGRTALHLAAHHAHASCVQQLLRHLKAGSDIDALDGESFTPLLRAAQSGDAACVQALVDAGANLHVKSADGRTAYDLASDDSGAYNLLQRIKMGKHSCASVPVCALAFLVFFKSHAQVPACGYASHLSLNCTSFQTANCTDASDANTIMKPGNFLKKIFHFFGSRKIWVENRSNRDVIAVVVRYNIIREMKSFSLSGSGGPTSGSASLSMDYQLQQGRMQEVLLPACGTEYHGLAARVTASLPARRNSRHMILLGSRTEAAYVTVVAASDRAVAYCLNTHVGNGCCLTIGRHAQRLNQPLPQSVPGSTVPADRGPAEQQDAAAGPGAAGAAPPFIFGLWPAQQVSAGYA